MSGGRVVAQGGAMQTCWTLAIIFVLSPAALAKGRHGGGGHASPASRPHAGAPRPHAYPVGGKPHAVPVGTGGKPASPPPSACPLGLSCAGWNGSLLHRSVFTSARGASCFCDPPCDEGQRCESDPEAGCACARSP